MKLTKIARIISVLLGPHVWFPVILVSLVLGTGLSSENIKILLPTLFFLLIIIPLLTLQLALKFKLISGWDLPRRQERYGLLTEFVICCLIATYFVGKYGNPLFGQITASLFLLIVVVFVITFFWKISIHTSLNTAGVLILIYLFGGRVGMVSLAIPLVFWARLYLKRHTVPQLLAGILVSLVIMPLAFR